MKKTSQNCKIDYITCSLGRKINFLKCGDNEGPVATFVAILVKVLDTADLDDSNRKNLQKLVRLCCRKSSVSGLEQL